MRMFKKISKKAVGALLTATLLITSCLPVFAETSYGPGDTGAIQVTANINSTYTVELPATVVLKPVSNFNGPGSGMELRAFYNMFITPLFLGNKEAIVVTPTTTALSESIAKGSLDDMESGGGNYVTEFTLKNSADESKTVTGLISMTHYRYYSSEYAGAVEEHAKKLLGNDGSTVARTPAGFDSTGRAGAIWIGNDELENISTTGDYVGTATISWIKVTMD